MSARHPVTRAEALELLDDWAADEPLEALRHYPGLLSEYRLDACAIAEPAGALVYAHDLLTPERRAWCERSDQWADVQRRFSPDRLEAERRRVIALARGEVVQ